MDAVRKWLILKCQLELEEKINEVEYEALRAYFLNQQKPMKFNPYEPDNILRTREADFMKMVNSMEDNGSANALLLTEFQFYSKVSYYEEKYKKIAQK